MHQALKPQSKQEHLCSLAFTFTAGFALGWPKASGLSGVVAVTKPHVFKSTGTLKASSRNDKAAHEQQPPVGGRGVGIKRLWGPYQQRQVS